MDMGIGLDTTLRLSWSDHDTLIREAAHLGYGSAVDSLAGDVTRRLSCLLALECRLERDHRGRYRHGHLGRAGSSLVARHSGLTRGNSRRAQRRPIHLGIGTGGIYSEDFRRTWGRPAWPPVAMMRDYVSTVRSLLAGETIDHDGPSVSMHGVQLSFRPPHVPVFLGALGPQMLRLAGEVADGAALNWCTPDQIAYSRERSQCGS